MASKAPGQPRALPLRGMATSHAHRQSPGPGHPTPRHKAEEGDELPKGKSGCCRPEDGIGCSSGEGAMPGTGKGPGHGQLCPEPLQPFPHSWGRPDHPLMFLWPLPLHAMAGPGPATALRPPRDPCTDSYSRAAGELTHSPVIHSFIHSTGVCEPSNVLDSIDTHGTCLICKLLKISVLSTSDKDTM